MANIKLAAGTQKAAHDYELFEGDKVQVGLTSVVRINGDDNWFRMEVATTVREGETGTQAMKRAKGFIHEQYQSFIPETAHVVSTLGD